MLVWILEWGHTGKGRTEVLLMPQFLHKGADQCIVACDTSRISFNRLVHCIMNNAMFVAAVLIQTLMHMLISLNSSLC